MTVLEATNLEELVVGDQFLISDSRTNRPLWLVLRAIAPSNVGYGNAYACELVEHNSDQHVDTPIVLLSSSGYQVYKLAAKLSSPGCCPKCKSGDNVGDRFEPINCDQVHQVIQCEACGCQWSEMYEFANYEILEKEPPNALP